MASITSAAHGFWEVGSTWTGGVVPVENDKVTITHTVEISGGVAITAGDDTTTAININGNGALKFSRSRNTDFTAKGNIVIADNGTWDQGTIASPITGVTSIIRLNKSATPALIKYGFSSLNGGIVHIHGETITRNTKLNGALVGGETTIYVDDATGWKPGDKIFIAASEISVATATRSDFLTIHASYTPGSTTVTLTSAVLYPHMDNLPISNLSSNVVITNYDAGGTYRGFFTVNWGNLNAVSQVTLRYCRFESIGYSSGSPPYVGVDIRSSGVSYTTPKVVNDIIGITSGFSNSSGGGYTFSSHSSFPAINITDCSFATQYGSGMNFASGTTFNITRCVVSCLATCINTGYSEGGKGVTLNDCDIISQNGSSMFGATGLAFNFNNCRFFGRGYMFTGAALPGTIFNNCDIGYTYPLFTATTGTTFLGFGTINGISQFTMNDCMVGSNIGYMSQSPSSSDFGEANAVSKIWFNNKNMLANSQEIQVPNGYIFRDNTINYRSNSSIMFQPLNTSIPLTQVIPVDTLNNVPVTVTGYLRYNTIWGDASMPSVTLDGLGISPYTFTAISGAANTWQKFEVTKTQSSGADGQLSLTFSGATANANGNQTGGGINTCQAWLSGVTWGSFVNSTRHYGYMFDGNTFRTLDSKITETNEVTVGAYATIDTLDQLYDRLNLWGAENPATPIFYSYTGSDLDLGPTNLIVDSSAPSGAFSYVAPNLTIKSNELTSGTKFTKVKTTGSLTESNGAIVSSLYETSEGPSSKLFIHIPVAGMALELHNMSTSEELTYIPSVSGDYSVIFAPISGADDTFKWLINKQGYVSANGSFKPKAGGLFEYTPDCPQVLTPAGAPMYQGTSSSLVDVSISGSTAYIDIGDGTPPLQAIFDEYEDYSVTSIGMNWLMSGKDGIRTFESPAGDYLFMTSDIRLRRRLSTDANATVGAFVQSVDGIPVDETNGPVRYLTSDSSEAIANAVWQNLTALAMTSNITTIDKLSKLIPAAL